MLPAIRSQGTLWAKAIELSNANAKKPEGRGDAFVYFVGARASGKSTLLNRFLYPARTELPKPSEGLEYTYARKPAAFDHEKKDLAHIWEIGGSSEFAEEIAQGEHVFLTFKQIMTGVVVIVADLSDPANVLPTVTYWLDQVKKKLASTYEKFEKKGLQLPEQLRQRAKAKLFGGHEDKDLVNHSGIAIVIAATKYDTFKDQDPEVKKVMGRALRFIAHANGAFLTYLSGLHTLGDPSAGGGGGSRSDAAQDRALLDNFTRLMNHLIFTGLDKKPSLKMAPQVDHAVPLMVPAGTDKFKDIGRPRGGAPDGNVPGTMQEWRDMYEKFFPPSKDKDVKAGKAPKFEIPEQYKEEEVDATRTRKLQELENLRKEVEAGKEAARKKALMAKAQAAEKAKKAGGSSGAKSSASGQRSSANGVAVKAPPSASGSGGSSSKSTSKAKAPAAAPAPAPAAG